LLKKGRQIEKQFRKNTVYSIPCAECPKKYCWTDDGNIKEKK